MPTSAGIRIGDDPCNDPNAPSLSCIVNGGGTAVARGNLVKGNRLRGNDLDILLETQGRGNVVRNNDCLTSQPAGLCRLR